MRARSKFRDGHWPDVQAELRGERARLGPSASVYCLSIKYDAPGVFYLAAILPTAAGTPRREYFTVSPSGFYFRKRARPRSRSNPTLPYSLCALWRAQAASSSSSKQQQQQAAAAKSAGAPVEALAADVQRGTAGRRAFVAGALALEVKGLLQEGL